MYVYEMSFPIDDFAMMRKFSEWYKHSIECEQKEDLSHFEFYTESTTLRSLLRRSLRRLAMIQTFWEGDVRDNELYIGSIPDDEDYATQKYFIALKQDNNGSSYIVSEIALNHLKPREKSRERDQPVTEKIQVGIKEILERYAPEPKHD